MTKYTDRALLLALGLCLSLWAGFETLDVITFLTTVIVSALMVFLRGDRARMVPAIFFLLLMLYLPDLIFYLPVLFYEAVNRDRKLWWCALGALAFFQLGDVALIFPYVITVLLCGTAVVLSLRAAKTEHLERELIHQRDTSTEKNLVLQEKNKVLLEKQDNEVHMATLKERNRIAREIHDNVGHMLSRSILQMGALMAIYKDEPLHQQLTDVNATLNQAMTSIRESVHDLRDDSIDLNQMIEEMLAPMKDTYKIDYQYDMGDDLPGEVKLCFVGIIKEALSNIVKHSDATAVSLVLREQPAFYQLSLEDNGTTVKNSSVDGMGVTNMQTRARQLGGVFRAGAEEGKGYKIFVSVPK